MTKKSMSTTPKIVELKAEGKKRFKLFRFFRDVKEEMKKVSWTKKAELKIATKIVIGSTIVLGLGIYLVDLGIRSVIVGIGNLARMIVG